MALETGTYIDDLVTTNPVGSTDPKSQGDDHLRLIKSVLKTTFPNASRVFRFEEAPAAKTATYNLTAADQRRLITVDCTSGALTITADAISSLFAGWIVTVMKVDSSSNAVTIDPNSTETINGATTYTLDLQYEFVTLMVQGSEFKIVGTGFQVGNTEGKIPQLAAGPALDSTIHGSAVPVGAILEWASATAPTGWHLMNGNTIGSASSGATHAAATEESLFTYLWDNFADAEAPVSSGRGASAAADWSANKTITIPNWSGVLTIGAGSAQTVTEGVTAANVSVANDTFTVLSNTYRWTTGMKVQVSTSGTLPTGISASTDYYVIRDSATTIKLATSLANAVAGTQIDITAAGSGTHTLEHTLTSHTVGRWFGEETHAQVEAEIAKHRHPVPYDNNVLGPGSTRDELDGAGATTINSHYTGSNSPMNNMPPARALYKIIRW